jgi:hypothetical protein
MTNHFYPEEFQDFPKSQKKQEIKPKIAEPSKLTLQFILGYGAALSVFKTHTIGNMKILMN